MSAQTPGRGVAGVEPREGHPGPADTLARVLKNHYLADVVCDPVQKADNPRCACSRVHLGWHPSIGAAVDAWIQHVLSHLPAEDWAERLFEQRDEALATVERVRALLQARAVECPGAEFIAIADIKAALIGGLERRVKP